MATARFDPSTAAWLRRAPHYLYVSDLVSGRRVLEVGCGSGFGAHFLANHGAGKVVGIDPSAGAIAAADERFRVSNLEYRREDLDSVELDDATFDCILVPDGAAVLRRNVVLQELRRLLAPRGYLVLTAPSADRPNAVGGVSYYEFLDRLEAAFAPVRMVAQSPFVAMSLVEYSGGGPEPAIELDTTLVELDEGGGEVTDYVAICGGDGDNLRGFAIMQLPPASGVDAVRASLGLASETSGPDVDLDLHRRFEEAELDRARAAALVRELRERVADLEDELDRARIDPAPEAAEDVDTEWEADHAPTRVAYRREPEAAEHEFEDAPTTAIPAAASLSGVIAEAMDAHGRRARELDDALEESLAYVDELRDELARERQSLAGETARAAGLQDQLDRVRRELAEWRTRASVAEGTVLRYETAGPAGADAALRDELEQARRTVDQVRGARADLEQQLITTEARRAELEGHLEDSEDAKAELEARLADAEARAGELERPESADPAPAPAAGAVLAMRHRLGTIERELAGGRELLVQLTQGLEALKSAERNGESAPGRQQELSFELGIKDAELTLLNVGLSSLQQRLRDTAERIRQTRDTLVDQPPAEIRALMDELVDALAPVAR